MSELRHCSMPEYPRVLLEGVPKTRGVLSSPHLPAASHRHPLLSLLLNRDILYSTSGGGGGTRGRRARAPGADERGGVAHTAADTSVAEQAVSALQAALGDRLVAVVLFGSRARGDAHLDSDWDLLVLAEGLPEGLF